jgi:plasmid stability protein
MATTTKSHEPAWVSVRLPPALRAKLVRTAERHDRSVTAEIRRALTSYLRPGERGERNA